MSERAPNDRFAGSLVSEKRNLLFSRVALCGTFLATIHTFSDALDGLRAAPVIDAIFTLIIFSSYLFNRRGYHKTAKVITLSVLNLGFAAYASVLPKEVGVYIFYLPLIAVAATVFDNRDKVLRHVFIGVPLLFLCLLFLADFKLLGNVSVEARDIPESYLLNLFSSSLFLVFCIHFLVRINETSEEKLMDLAREIQQKNDRLEKANGELDRFLYSTSHDLRAPLMSIKGLINLAQREGITSVPRYLQLMDQQTDKLDSFIKEIIDYSKNARMELRPEPVDLKSTVQDVTSYLKYMEGADRINFECEVQFSDQLITDKSRIQIILNNLISNSIKYHDLEQEKPVISVSAERCNGHWVLAVADNGRGIAPEHKEKVFDMFYRADERSKGSGLGLFIVKETVSKLKGKIEVESEPRRGTQFKVTLPWN